jgi:hydroxyacylglutathione hydrolase
MTTTPGAMRRCRQCAIRRSTVEFVAPTVEEASKEFNIKSWPTGTGQVDLGGRVLAHRADPGARQGCDCALRPQNRRIAHRRQPVSGAAVCSRFCCFQSQHGAADRFLEGKPVAHVLGNHIEETRTAFKDFPIGSIYHPNEHALELSFGDLLQLEDGLKSLEGAAPLGLCRFHHLAAGSEWAWAGSEDGRDLQEDAGPTAEEQMGSAKLAASSPL